MEVLGRKRTLVLITYSSRETPLPPSVPHPTPSLERAVRRSFRPPASSRLQTCPSLRRDLLRDQAATLLQSMPSRKHADCVRAHQSRARQPPLVYRQHADTQVHALRDQPLDHVDGATSRHEHLHVWPALAKLHHDSWKDARGSAGNGDIRGAGRFHFWAVLERVQGQGGPHRTPEDEKP